MPDAADRVPDELTEQVTATTQVLTRLVTAAYGKGLRDGLQGSSNVLDSVANMIRVRPDAHQLTEVIGLLDSMRDQLRLSAHEVTIPDIPGPLS